MNVARASARLVAGWARREPKQTRAALTDSTVLAFFFGVTLVLAWIGNPLRGAGIPELLPFFDGPMLLGIVALGCCIARSGPNDRLDLVDWTALLVSCPIIVHPSPYSPALALTLVGLSLARHRATGLGRAGLVAIGMAWLQLWGPLMLNIVAPWLLPFEAWLAFLPLSASGDYTIQGQIIGRPGGFAVTVLPACSAFSNTVRTGFMWLALGVIFEVPVRRQLFVGLALALGLVVILNTARTAMMARSYELYEYWHEGMGLTWFNLALIGAALLPFALVVESQAKDAPIS